jgi:hypothetical protein
MLACVSLCLLVLSSPAWAQQGRGGREGRMPRMRQLSPEKAKAAWTWQARELARALDLGADETNQLIEAYVAGRKKFSAAVREAREAATEGEQPRGWRVDPDLAKDHRAALQTNLSGFLSEDQAEEATRSLGLFSTQWDRMVDGVAGLELGEQKTYAALTPIRQYMTQMAGIRRRWRSSRSPRWDDVAEGARRWLADKGVAKAAARVAARGAPQRAPAPRRSASPRRTSRWPTARASRTRWPTIAARSLCCSGSTPAAPSAAGCTPPAWSRG